jgi:menaquinone-dependent protoporphyrinogen oxidase
MKVLITVASKHGSTLAIGEAIAASLRGAGADAAVRPISDVESVSDYAAVIIGSGVYAGQWRGEAKEFIERHADELRRRPVWLFSSGPLGDPPVPADDPVDAAPLVATVAAREHRVFAGSLARERLGLGERAVVKVVRAPYGDFRDWSQIAAWADEIAASLKEIRVPA